ncbi:hypothetical protein PI125_g18426 [Phytophthora idaei]|nr:hypothetical protein PI125_g18426 [Phytophthora idaei]KAG3140774.1 hypothetical protein PI126_g15831 [Phytophthora idaei]
MSESDTKYFKNHRLWPSNFVGFQKIDPRYDRTYIYGSNTSLRFYYQRDLGPSYMVLSSWDGEYQDLIVWEQLTDAARVALNDLNNFGKAEVPFNDE